MSDAEAWMTKTSFPQMAGFNAPPDGRFWAPPDNELLNTELFDTLLEARVLIERWRTHYNTIRPHSSLGYKPPAPEAVLPIQTTT
jgi:transposase InsO family protein